jgi:hypothetical protein
MLTEVRCCRGCLQISVVFNLQNKGIGQGDRCKVRGVPHQRAAESTLFRVHTMPRCSDHYHKVIFGSGDNKIIRIQRVSHHCSA